MSAADTARQPRRRSDHLLSSLPIAPWAGLGLLAAWATASLLVGGLLLRLRDA